jgi:hypothetical protein
MFFAQRLRLAAGTALALASLACPGLAWAIDKIYSPDVVEDEFEIEYSGSTTFDKNHDRNNLQSHEAELEYAPTGRLDLELAADFEKEPDGHLNITTTGFGGRYQFFDQGEYWLDAGALVTYNAAIHRGSDPDTIEAKLLLEKQWGRILSRANIGIEQDVGSHAEGGPDRVFLWNSRYRLGPNFEPGFEVQSDFGKPNEHAEQQYIGPAMFGRLLPGLNYEAAYYFGVNNGASKNAARILLEYEMHF